MRRLHAALAVFVVSTLGLALAGPQAPLDPAAVERFLQDSGGGPRLSVHPATGALRFVRLQPGRLALDGADEVERAQAFLNRYGAVFGIGEPEAELSGPVLRTDRLGHTRLSYGQLYRGLPVFAGLLHAHFDGQGRLAAVNGTFVPGISVDTRPAWKQEQAEAVAIADVRKRLEVGSALELHGSKLLVFRTGLVQRVPGRDHLVYEVEVGNGFDVREYVYVDAHDGRIVDRIAGIHSALARKIHEPRFNDSVIWNEGEAVPYSTGDPTNDGQVNGLIDTSADAYQLYSNLSGGSYLSWDGQDSTMHSVWKADGISCPNATWNGSTTNYCDGVAGDDVAAHEWTHGYTETTHGLIYQWQPGALNEAYSDMFGELIDLLNGAGTDSPDVMRTEGDCSTFGGSLPPTLVIDAPPAIAGPYAVRGADFNPPPPISAAAQVERVDDDDQSGKMHLDSPPIVLTGEASVAFDHWVATEAGFDGGNLRISVNDGPFQIVAAEEFIVNAYNDVLITAEANNTNPLAGEPAFTGADGGTVHGTWGQSQIFLGAQAGAGDTLRIRFEFGVDGCNGLQGWYVDNLLVCSSEVSAGRVPNGGNAPGTPLVVGKALGTEITLTWAASCHRADADYEIYEGAIGDFDGHSAKFCSTAGATTKSFEPGSGDVYYLIVPRNLDREGSYGMDSDDNERPQGGAACLEQSINTSCP